MTQREWEKCSYVLENCWHGEFDDDRSAAYYAMLRGHSAAEVEAALRRLVQDPRPFIPTVPEIIAAIREMTEEPVPSWSEVWPAIQRALDVGARVQTGTSDRQRAAIAWLEEHVHPVVARFFEVETYGRLSLTPFFDPDYGELRVKELRQRFEQFVGVARERLSRGLALPGGQDGNGQPRRLDQVAMLGQLAPAAAQLPAGG